MPGRPRLSRFAVSALVALGACALAPAAFAAPTPKIEPMECGPGGDDDEVCDVTVVTDKDKAELDKKDHGKVILVFRAEATQAQFASVAKLPWLEHLSLTFNENVKDLSPLAGLKKLRDVNFTASKDVADLTPLAGHPELRSVQLVNTDVRDLGPLKDAKKLQSIELPIFIDDITPLKDCTELEEIDMASDVKDWSPFKGWTKLKHVHAAFAGLKDLSPFANHPALERLEVSQDSVLVDLSAVATLPALTSLDVSFTKVADLTPVAKLTNLKKLGIYSTKVSSLAPLAKLTKLEEVEARLTQVKDFSPLAASAKTLKTLRVPKGTPASAYAAVTKENPKLKVDVDK